MNQLTFIVHYLPNYFTSVFNNLIFNTEKRNIWKEQKNMCVKVNVESIKKRPMPVVIEWLYTRVRGVDNSSAAASISLFGISNDNFCTFRLEKSLLTWISVIGDITNKMNGLFPQSCPTSQGSLSASVDIIFWVQYTFF